MKQILILCTGNTCRSQMAQGFLASLYNNIQVLSAGTVPGSNVNSNAIKVMNEIGIDISNNYPKSVDNYLDQSFDFVITVCDGAKEACPAFVGKVDTRLHIGFEDPADATGTPEEVLNVFRKVRDEIIRDFTKFYNDYIKK
ncbi:MAG: arsenate reductase ArsC [Candidatus Kapaibacteriota bacterium]